MIYYKATDLEGRDFRTGTVQFIVGESVPALPEREYPTCCTSDVYHASIAPESTLIGGSWPCRLFEVTGEAVAEKDQKRGFYTFKVVREIEAWRALGPNGREVASLIERCKTLTEGEVRRLRTVRSATRDASRGAAWDAAEDAVWGATRDAAWDAAQDAAWDASRGTAWDAAEGAAWGAVTALVVRDLISTELFEELYEPWRSVMGDPEITE